MFYKNSCSWKFRKIHRKTLVSESLLIKLQAWGFIKKEILAQVFSCEFFEIFKIIFFKEHLWTTASENSWTKILLNRTNSELFEP